MSRAAILAVLLAAVAAGCLGRSSAHGVMTGDQARAQAVHDGLAGARLQPNPASLGCTSRPPYLERRAGRSQRAGYVHPRYSLVVGDRRIPRPLRRLAGLALLPVPGPFDEAVLVLIAVPLFVFYRRQVRDAWCRAGVRETGKGDVA